MIGDKLKNFDVGVVVLNAGYVFKGPYIDLRDDEIERHICWNIPKARLGLRGA